MLNKKYLAFDLEIVKEIPEDTDWKDVRPLGISCAATIATGEDNPRLFYHGQEKHTPMPGPMTVPEVQEMVHYMLAMQHEGYTLLTWNGVQFDFDVLAEESKMPQECRRLALDSVDMMFHFFCDKGYPLGLDTAAKGQGLEGKMQGMSGAKAPVMWAESLESRYMVIGYVGRDARVTLEVADICEMRGKLMWTSRSGRLNSMLLNTGWLKVEECLSLPLPDNSWMSDPLDRETFISWLNL